MTKLHNFNLYRYYVLKILKLYNNSILSYEEYMGLYSPSLNDDVWKNES